MSTSIPPELDLAPDPLGRPPTLTKLQSLPIQELTWENFEKLCLRVARYEASISQCVLYGTRGQEQAGIDFIGFPKNIDQSKLHCYQCKNVTRFRPADITAAVDKFLDGEWANKTQKFVLCVRVPLISTKQVARLTEQRARLLKQRIEFEIWDGGEAGALTEKLKQNPVLVDDFFGRQWAISFNGVGASHALSDRLDGADAAILRKRLGNLYDTLFSRHDPGTSLAPGIVIPHLSRYIPPDIVERTATRSFPSVAMPETPIPISDGIEGADEEQLLRRGERMSARLAFDLETRYQGIGWITAERKAVILGDPGMGKSAFLRFIALALLHRDVRFPELTRTWGDCFPVWISFGAWTEEIAKDNSVSLEDFVSAWLHRNSADDLKSLFLRALHDRRLLLLVDGLDEGIDEANSRKALDRLHAFLSQTQVPAVLTSRPRGFERMQVADDWAIARLADLTDKQVHDLAHNWYRHLISQNETDAKKIDETANRYVDEFCRELLVSSRISDLSRTPLLCLLLVEVKRHAGRIPENRFKAYEKITQFLIAEHPELRRQAAEATGQKVLVGGDDTIEALGELAWEIQCNFRAGFAPRRFCVDVLESFFKDDLKGLGLPAREAREITKLLLDHVRTSLGLLVERSQDELGFFHLTLQEYLCARALTRRSSEIQIAEIASRANDSDWYEVIVAWFGIQGTIHRNREITEKAGRSLQSTYMDKPIQRARILPLLGELSFGDVGLPPRYGSDIQLQIIEEVERSPFPALQQELCRWVVLGLRSPKANDLVKQRLKAWYPARDSSTQFEMLRHMQSWKRSEGVYECLKRCLYSGVEDVQLESARALANSGRNEAKKWLLELANHEVDPSRRATVIQAVVEKWPSEQGLADLLSHEILNDHPDVKFCAVEGRIQLGLHQESDFKLLWEVRGYGSGLSWSRQARIHDVVVAGWSKSAAIKQALLEVVRNPQDRFDDNQLALGILVSSYRQDDEIAQVIASELRRSHGSWGMGRRDLWSELLKNYSGHSIVTEAVSAWMAVREERHAGVMKHMGPDESFAFAIIGTEDTRQKILSYLRGTEGDQISKEWAVSSLDRGWLDKGELAGLFSELKNRPIEEIAWFADVSKVAVPEEIRRSWLLKVVANPKVKSIREACRALLSTWKDEEVLATILQSLSAPRWYYEIKAIKAQLVETFPTDPRILPLVEDLWNDADGANAGAVAALGDFNDLIRQRVFNAVAPACDPLRAAAVENLASKLSPSVPAMSILEDALFETDGDIGTAGVLALVSYIGEDAELANVWAKRFVSEATAIGFRMDVRNLFGVLGLIKLGRLDLVEKNLGDRNRIELWLETDLRGGKVTLRTEILRNWDALKIASKGAPWTLLGVNEGRLWETLSPHCVRFSEVRNDAMEYLHRVFGKSVGPGTLNLMSSYFPRDENVLATCYSVLQDRKPDGRLATSTALRIIGQQFGGNDKVREKLGEVLSSRGVRGEPALNELLLALCYGWPSDPAVSKFRSAPLDEWRGLSFEIACHLCRVTENAERMGYVLDQAIRAFSGRNSYGVGPIVGALRMWTSGAGRDETLDSWIENPNPSIVVTAVSLLSLTGPVSGIRRKAFENMFDSEVLSRTKPPRVGFDMTVGVRRPLADALYEAVVGNRKNSRNVALAS